jgi:hypothetical protein
MISKGVDKPNVKVQRLSVAKANAKKRDARVAAFSEQVRAALTDSIARPRT